MKKGKLIVIDGGDNVGKATQTELLMRRLMKEDYQVGILDFPRYEQNTFGKLLKECLEGERGDFLSLDPRIAATLYAVDRFEAKETITEWLKEGRIIVLDRYVSANMLHQGAKIPNEVERESFFQWLEHVEYEIFGIPKPDLVVYLSIPAEESEKLLQYVANTGTHLDIADSDLEHQRKVFDTAEYLMNRHANWFSVMCMKDGELRTREEIHEELYKLIKKHI